jgi:hypothetical protein
MLLPKIKCTTFNHSCAKLCQQQFLGTRVINAAEWQQQIRHANIVGVIM